MKIIKFPIVLILIFSVLLSLGGCSRGKNVEYCELGIVLTRDFESYDSGGAFSTAYSDGNVIVGITRYSFVDCEEVGLLTTHTPLGLAKVYAAKLDSNLDEEVTEYGDIPYFSYTEATADGTRYFYMTTFYRTPYAYFVITFITPKARQSESRKEIFGYMDSVYLLDEYM